MAKVSPPHPQTIIADKLYKCENGYFAIECNSEVQDVLTATSDKSIFLGTYGDFNLNTSLK